MTSSDANGTVLELRLPRDQVMPPGQAILDQQHVQTHVTYGAM